MKSGALLILVSVFGLVVAAPEVARAQPDAPCTDGRSCFDEGSAALDSADYEWAFQKFKDACDKGWMAGCTATGAAYAAGRGVAKDPKLAIALVRKACDGKDGHGCSLVAQWYQDGVLTTQDLAQAAAYYLKGCELGFAIACNSASIMYWKGQGVALDKAKALTLMERGCALKLDVACKNIPLVGGKAPAPPAPPAAPAAPDAKAIKNAAFDAYAKGDVANAAKLARQACDLGALMGCSLLGRMNEDGSGMPRDRTAAKVLYTKACDGGEPNGCVRLGEVLKAAAKGRVTKDAKRAFERGCLLARYENVVMCDGAVGTSVDAAQKLCDQNAPVACTKLAQLLLDRHKAADDKRAREVAQKACDLSNGFGCLIAGNLAYLLPPDQYFAKQDAAYDRACALSVAEGCAMGAHWLYERNAFDKAAALYDRACNQLHDWDQCRLLGDMYKNGLGVPKDLTKARAYWTTACDKGIQTACDNLGQ